MSTPTALEAAAAIRDHHTELEAGLLERVAALRAAGREGGPFAAAKDRIVAYLDAEIVPHALAEERTLYPAAAGGPAALLVEAMLAEHRDLLGRVGELRAAADLVAAVSAASAIEALFVSHLEKENERLVPALLAMPGVSLGDLLAGLHELVG